MNINGLLRIFGLEKEDQPGKPASWATMLNDQPAKSAAPSAEEFQRKLASIVQNSGVAAAGQIQFLGLETIRARIGTRWDRLKDRIDIVVRRSIEAAIGSNEIYVPYDEMKYLLVFSEPDEDKAALKCALILQSLHTALFGEDDIGEIEIQSLVSVVDEELVLESKSLDDCIKRVADKVTSTGTPVSHGSATAQPSQTVTSVKPVPQSAASEGGPDYHGPVVEQTTTRLDNHHGRVVEQTTTRLDSVDPPMPVRASSAAPPFTPAVATQPAPATQPPPAAAIPAPIIDKPAPTARPDVIDSSMSFVYVPVWNAKQQAISAYHCVPSKKTGDGTLFGYAAIYGKRSLVQSVDFDILALRHSIELFTELLANSFEYLAVHSVNYDTLKDPMRQRAFLAACHCIPAEIAPYQIIEIFGAPETVPTSRHAEMVSSLRPFFKHVLLRTSLRGEHLDRACSAGYHGFSMPVQDDLQNTADTHAQITKIGQKLKSLGSTGYGLDIRSNQTMLFAADAGFTWVGGHHLLKPVKTPSHVERYPRSKFEAA
jgi:hypothetical protein